MAQREHGDRAFHIDAKGLHIDYSLTRVAAARFGFYFACSRSPY